MQLQNHGEGGDAAIKNAQPITLGVLSLRFHCLSVKRSGNMGADETAPLLPHGTASKSDLAVPVAFDDTSNTWNGSLIKCCAGCDSTGWGSCLFSYFVPCVAFGYVQHLRLDVARRRSCTLTLCLNGISVAIGKT